MPPLEEGAHPLRRRAAGIIGSSLAALVFDAAILVNTVVELYRMSVEVEGAPPTPTVSALLALQKALLALFCVEFTLKLTVWGPLRLLGAGVGPKLDALVLAASLGAALGEIGGALPPSVSLLILTLRSLRLVRYWQKLRVKVGERAGVEVLPGLDATLSALLDCLPHLARFLAASAALYYGYVVVGSEAFAGVLSLGNPVVAASSYGTWQVFTSSGGGGGAPHL